MTKTPCFETTASFTSVGLFQLTYYRPASEGLLLLACCGADIGKGFYIGEWTHIGGRAHIGCRTYVCCGPTLDPGPIFTAGPALDGFSLA